MLVHSTDLSKNGNEKANTRTLYVTVSVLADEIREDLVDFSGLYVTTRAVVS